MLILLEHSKEHGALAIALNRPTENELGDVLERDSLKRTRGCPLLGGTSSISRRAEQRVDAGSDARADAAGAREFAGADGAEALLPGCGSGPPSARPAHRDRRLTVVLPLYAGAFVWEAGDLEAEIEAGASTPRRRRRRRSGVHAWRRGDPGPYQAALG